MKRMVENSEKIEELADALTITKSKELLSYYPTVFREEVNVSAPFGVSDVSIFGDRATFYEGLVTSNILTINNDNFGLFSESDYSISDDNAQIGLEVVNIGTALIANGLIGVGQQNGEYTIMTLNYDKMDNIICSQIYGRPVCTINGYRNSNNKTLTIKISLNKEVSEFPVAEDYRFSFIVGTLGKEIL